MNCKRCGNTLPTNSTGCPHCDGAPSHTKKLSEKDLHKTRALVQLERCENCGWMVYPTDDECSACGTWVNRPWKQNGAEKKPRRRGRKAEQPRVQSSGDRYAHDQVPHGGSSRQVWVGVAISIAVLCLFAIAWHFMFPSYLQ